MRIAEHIGRDRRTVNREIARNQCDDGSCDAQKAHERFEQRRRLASRRPSAVTEVMEERIRTDLKNGLSPEQITGRRRRQGQQIVSHETICQLIYSDAEAGGDLYQRLPRARKRRRKRPGSSSRGSIPGRRPIAERPACVEQRERIGDWEVDTVLSPRSSRGGLVVAVERSTRLMLIAKIECLEADHVEMVLVQLLRGHVVYTITSDNGKEFSNHTSIARQLAADYFFADAYRPSQRGTNENSIGLIRRPYPKGTDFSAVPDVDIEILQSRLNARPRKCLGYATPNEVYYHLQGYTHPPGGGGT